MAGLRVLFIAEKLPLPTRGGRDMRVWPHVLAATRQGPVAMFGLHALPPAPPPIDGIEVWRSSADPTLTQTRSGAQALAWLRDPEASPADQYLTETSATEIQEILSTFRPDVAVLEGVVLHRYIPLFRAAGCRLVVDCHNVEATLEHDVAAITNPHEGMVRRQLAARMSLIEARAVKAADRIWATSPDDAVAITEIYRPDAPLTVVPNAVDVESYPGARGSAGDLLYPANFGSVANHKAALFLMREVLPALARTAPPGVGQPRLTLAGIHPPASVLAAAAADDRVVVTGVVDDIRPLLAKAGAMPIPLMAGSGTRFKALEAFASRLPVVSTAIGVGGLDAAEDIHYRRAETSEDFAAQLWSLREPATRADLVAAARRLVEERYSWAAVTAIVLSELAHF